MARSQAGTVFVGEGASSDWQLTVDGKAAKRSPAFGWANAFEVPAAGQATLRYDTSPIRWVAVVAQALCWLAVLWLALRIGHRRARRRAAVADTGVLIDLGHEPVAVGVAATPAALEAPGPTPAMGVAASPPGPLRPGAWSARLPTPARTLGRLGRRRRAPARR